MRTTDDLSADSSTVPKVAWIAGVGASAGLGAAVARRFSKAALVVALTGRNAERVRSVAAEIAAAGGRAQGLPGDVSSADDVQRLVGEVAALGPLGAAVFNAGNAVRGTVLEITPEQFESTRPAALQGSILILRRVEC